MFFCTMNAGFVTYIVSISSLVKGGLRPQGYGTNILKG